MPATSLYKSVADVIGSLLSWPKQSLTVAVCRGCVGGVQNGSCTRVVLMPAVLSISPFVEGRTEGSKVFDIGTAWGRGRASFILNHALVGPSLVMH